MKTKTNRIAALILLSLLPLSSVLAIDPMDQDSGWNISDSILNEMEEITFVDEPELEVASWMLVPFYLESQDYAYSEPELEVEDWMIEPFQYEVAHLTENDMTNNPHYCVSQNRSCKYYISYTEPSSMVDK